MRVGNYEDLVLIGQGGFGEVYKAKHMYLNTFSSVKMNIKDDEEDVKILKREAKILWRINEHHSIPSVRDFFPLSNKKAVLVTSLIEGKTLEEELERNSLNVEDGCWILERLLGALYYSHYNGVIHTDIKPQNIFIEKDKHDIKLIDFGFASFEPKNSTRPVGYSPKYAAPEILMGRPPLPQSDLYGAGMMFEYILNKNTNVPNELKLFSESLMSYLPEERPSWENDNPIEKIAQLREKLFGRRHSIAFTRMKGGEK